MLQKPSRRANWQRSAKPQFARACAALLAAACGFRAASIGEGYALPRAGVARPYQYSPAQREARERMVRAQIASRGVHDARVLAALRKVPRHLFIPSQFESQAYEDHPVPIGYGQTISQPYIVAFMSEALELKPQDKVLEIGTGSGYQAAVLAELVREVYTIEIVEPLARSAEERLKGLQYSNVHVRAGDGYHGWPEAAPFDAIIVTAAPERVPQPLIDQLRLGGRLVVPVGRYMQDLVRLRRTPQGIKRESLLPVMFVPMTGEAQKGKN